MVLELLQLLAKLFILVLIARFLGLMVLWPYSINGLSRICINK